MMSVAASLSSRSNSFLGKITRTWFGVMFLGQLIFAIYILLQYVLNGIIGNLAAWSESSTGGYTEGDQMGNVTFGIHVVLAAVITIGGPLQLIPKIRNKYPRFHRVNGRVYIIAAYVISVAGIYLIWVRGTVGDTTAHIMTTINGVIILVAATYTIRHALARNITIHQKWAIRLFLAMSGVYFFRVLLNCWLITLQDTGIDFDTFTGPGLDFIGFSSYILPQIITEAYFRIRRQNSNWSNQLMIGFMGLLILIFIIGTIGATVLMWLPEVT